MTRFISCREFVDFVWAYLSGEVTEGERREFEYHLTLCPSCVAYMNGYKETIRLSKLAYQDDGALPEDVPEELVAAVLAARELRGGTA